MKKTLLRCGFVAAAAVAVSLRPAGGGRRTQAHDAERTGDDRRRQRPAAADPAGVGARRPDEDRHADKLGGPILPPLIDVPERDALDSCCDPRAVNCRAAAGSVRGRRNLQPRDHHADAPGPARPRATCRRRRSSARRRRSTTRRADRRGRATAAAAQSRRRPVPGHAAAARPAPPQLLPRAHWLR